MSGSATVTEVLEKVKVAEANNAKIASELATIKKERDEFETQLKSLKMTPDLTGVRRGGDGRISGGWGYGDESVNVVIGDPRKGPNAMQPSHASQMKSMIRAGYEPYSQFKSMGHFLREGLEKGHTSEFADKMRTQCKAIQGMSEKIGADGGFAVLPEFSHTIFEHLFGNTLFNKTNNFTVSGNNMVFLANAETSRANGSRHGGLRGYWAGEGDSGTASKPTMREINLRLQKLMVVVYLTNELIDDNGFALEQYVNKKASSEFEFMTGDAIINGDGNGKPLGVLKAPSLISVAAEGGQGGTTIVGANVAKMQNRMFAPYFQNAEWYCNQDAIQQLMQLSLATGTYSGQLVFMPPTGLAGAPYGTLGGRPINPIEFCPTLGAVGDLTLADLSQMISISKGGIEQAVSMHVEFLSDQMALRFTLRMNACPWENAPLTPYQGSNTQSSFVTIAAR